VLISDLFIVVPQLIGGPAERIGTAVAQLDFIGNVAHGQNDVGLAIERTSAMKPFCRSVFAVAIQRWSSPSVLWHSSIKAWTCSAMPFALLMSAISASLNSR